MPCYTCGTDFGIFKKEIGCEICGFSFCGKCCKKREIVSQNGELKKQTVCNKCYTTETRGKSSTTGDVSPPLAHKKRMQALKKQSYSVDSARHESLQSEWSDDKDKEIAERLQKLKRDRFKAGLPTESEIEERIAKLKGMDPSKYNAPPIEVFRPSDRRTSLEKATDLIKEVTERVDLDSRIVRPEDEIEARLAKLKASDPINEGVKVPELGEKENIPLDKELLKSDDHNSYKPKTEEEEVNLLLEKAKLSQASKIESAEDIEMSEEEETNKIVEKFMAAKFEDIEELDSLNDQETEKSVPSDDQSESTEEFPWCVICTEDAKVRCFGCEGDLYCLRCLKECHDGLDIKDHKTCPFLPPKKPVL